MEEGRSFAHKNDSIYGAVYFMPIIGRNRANNNNSSIQRTIINVAPNILAEQTEHFFGIVYERLY